MLERRTRLSYSEAAFVYHADGRQSANISSSFYYNKPGHRFYQSTGRPKITEQNLLVRIGESEAKVANNMRLRSRCCTVEANY